jgi:hypothetical protein
VIENEVNGLSLKVSIGHTYEHAMLKFCIFDEERFLDLERVVRLIEQQCAGRFVTMALAQIDLILQAEASGKPYHFTLSYLRGLGFGDNTNRRRVSWERSGNTDASSLG